jgi:hypothetical protein
MEPRGVGGNVGEPGFEHGYPTSDASEAIHDEQDFQRAIEAYQFFYPTVSMEATFHGNRELGVEDSTGGIILSAGPHHVIFTSSSDTPYAAAVLDLRATGPAVIDLPAGPYVGLVDDHHHRWVIDLGICGPDGGSGGKYLLLPPDHRGDVPGGYHVGRARTYKVLVALRAVPSTVGAGDALQALARVKVHPLEAPARALRFVDVTDRDLDATPLRWEHGLEYWRKLHEVIDDEPSTDELRAMYGALAALGIEKGKAFAPDPRMQRLLVGAAKAGLRQMLVEGFASQRPERLVWKDRRWEWVALVGDADFQSAGYLDLEARERWFVQAIGASPAMFRRAVGRGSLSFLSARDRFGTYLEGGITYRLTVPQPVPAGMFWSVTAYDSATRAQVRTPQGKAALGSLHGSLTGCNGSCQLYFGPRAPRGEERRWIRTLPGRGFFLYFRIYGPEAPALDGRWRLDDPVSISLGG